MNNNTVNVNALLRHITKNQKEKLEICLDVLDLNQETIELLLQTAAEEENVPILESLFAMYYTDTKRIEWIFKNGYGFLY